MLNPTFNFPSAFPRFDLHGFGKNRIHGHGSEHVKRSERMQEMEPQKLVGRHVVGKLEKVLQKEGVNLQKISSEDFSPQTVADRIMSSVQQAYGQFKQSQPEGTDDSEFFSQVREGLEKGFAEARDILDSFGVLQGQISADVDETYQLTMERFDQLESGRGPETVGKLTEMAFQSVAMQSERSGQLQIETQEGDIVTVSFSQSAAASSSALDVKQQGASLNAFSQSYAYSSEFNISIEGDLNQDEQDALKDLMRQMHKVSNAFFHGNEKAAIRHAMKAGFNGEQIAGFSMDLSMQKSVQAVAAYQQTSMPEQTVNADLLQQAGDFLNSAKAILADARSAMETMAEPRQAFTDLFANIGLLNNDIPNDSVGIEDTGVFGRVVDNLGSDIFSGENTRKAA